MKAEVRSLQPVRPRFTPVVFPVRCQYGLVMTSWASFLGRVFRPRDKLNFWVLRMFFFPAQTLNNQCVSICVLIVAKECC